jgi:penicillin-binding protein 2
VGYAPAQDPKIVVAALVEHGEHGSSTAAPLVRQVIADYLEREATSATDDMARAKDR